MKKKKLPLIFECLKLLYVTTILGRKWQNRANSHSRVLKFCIAAVESLYSRANWAPVGFMFDKDSIANTKRNVGYLAPLELQHQLIALAVINKKYN